VSAGLRLEVEGGALDRARAEVAVVTLFEGERPLRGGAGRADWRLCGLLADLVAAGRLQGRAGEAALLPTSRRLAAPRLLVLGLGAPRRFEAEPARRLAEDAVARLLALGAGSAVLAPPDVGERAAWGPLARALAEGAGRAIGEGSLRLALLVPREALPEARKALARS
jgi:leucyl aminopeptidase